MVAQVVEHVEWRWEDLGSSVMHAISVIFLLCFILQLFVNAETWFTIICVHDLAWNMI